MNYVVRFKFIENVADDVKINFQKKKKGQIVFIGKQDENFNYLKPGNDSAIKHKSSPFGQQIK